MKTTRVNFLNESGYKLSAKLESPVDGKALAYAIFAHCFTCNKNLQAVTNISRALTQQGIAVLRFDFTGLGNSEGEFADTNFSSNVGDLIAASKMLEENYAPASLMIGHSLGGAAAIMAAAKIDSIKAVAAVGAPSEPGHVEHLFSSGLKEIEAEGSALVNIGGREFNIKKQFVDDINNNTLATILPDLNKALLILHSPQDTTVGIENAQSIYLSAKHPKSFVSLDGADHLLSKKEDSEYVGSMVASWAARYISLEQEEVPDIRGVQTRTGAKGYTTEILTGKHRLLADEPLSVGGQDLGPGPYDYLIAGLGACTGMTLRMYADRKQWDLKEIRVHLEHGKVHSDDSDANKKVDVITREIELEGVLSEEQRKRLLEIADRCPVHRTLHSEIRIETKLLDE